MDIFIAAVSLLLLSALLAPFSRAGSVFWDRLSLYCGLAGAVLGIAATVYCLLSPGPETFSLPWPTIGGLFALRIDGLAAVFLLPAFIIGGAGLLYGSGYWPHAEEPGGSAWIRFFYPLLCAAIALVLVADNGLVFLIGWETMALTGYFLVIADRDREENFRAGYLYLIATHTGTLALFALFALLGAKACLFNLPAAATLTGDGTALFLLALFGFGFKAGLMPLHIWLPSAHAAAPSHASALMSGVMIKTGIYGLIRIVSLFETLPPWWGWTVLGLGLLSGILGVLFAIAQHDIKRLLAYHSVENIGIILIGLGIAMLGKSHGLIAVAALGMAGALLHVVNHGLFKGLLFLAAGAVIRATGTRSMANYGGLLKEMPLTGLFFLGGAVAICGLPPLNGFVSEWFVYLGLLRGGINPAGEMNFVLLAIPGLAMIGGLALLCFAKVFGLAFLGDSRDYPAPIREAHPAMLTGMAPLLIGCLWIGILPRTVLPLFGDALLTWTGPPATKSALFAALGPTGAITTAALFLLALLFVFYLLPRKKKAAAGVTPTWGCGYGGKIPRARYTTASFAEMIVSMFSGVLRTAIKETKPGTVFPDTAKFASHTPDPVLDLLLAPVYRRTAGLAIRIRRTIHQGVLGIYLLYSALILCLFLALMD
jgi:hydrogenase-4 component B